MTGMRNTSWKGWWPIHGSASTRISSTAAESATASTYARQRGQGLGSDASFCTAAE